MPRTITIFVLSACAALAMAISTYAQVPGAMNETTATRLGGNSYLAGTVFSPTGRPLNVRMGIRLSSQTAGDYITTTDDRGQFIFSGLVAGDYSVVIEGDNEYESVSQKVEILQSRSAIPQTYTISIRLVDKKRSSPKPAVVAVESVGVTKRAAELYNKALELSADKNNKAAIEQLKLAVEAYPAFLNAYNEMGVQYMRLNELEKADEALQAALKIKADAFEPMLNRGIVLFRLKRFVDAQVLLQSAIGVKDRSAQAHFYLGRTLFALQRYDEAEKALDLAINIGGDEMKEAHRILAMMFIEKDDRPRALTALETYLRLVPNAPDAEQLKDALVQLRASIRPPEPPAKPLM